MNRDLLRRLRLIEQTMPSATVKHELTDEHRAMFVAINAVVVAILLGEFEPGEPPMDALHRGIERAFASSDRLSPLRDAYARRLRDAASIALNGTESVAVPPDWFERSRAVLDRPHAAELLEAFSTLYFAQSDLADPAGSKGRWTRIGGDAVEKYCWPQQAG